MFETLKPPRNGTRLFDHQLLPGTRQHAAVEFLKSTFILYAELRASQRGYRHPGRLCEDCKGFPWHTCILAGGEVIAADHAVGAEAVDKVADERDVSWIAQDGTLLQLEMPVFADGIAIAHGSGIDGGGGDHYFRDSTYGAYIQDDWKVRKDLSLNIGLRWDAVSNPTEAHGNLNPLAHLYSLPRVLSIDGSGGIARG